LGIIAVPFLLDTNILVYAYRNQGACRQRLEAADVRQVYLCSINVFEIERGIAKSQRPQALQLFLDDALARFPMLTLDIAASQCAARVRSHLEAREQMIGPYDVLIAGIALAHQCTLVTRNTAEFSRIDGLNVENWYGD
jgi:tRNA(fMet)-specific endonuclease VapC